MGVRPNESPLLLVVVPILASGGTEKQLLCILPYLVARGYRVVVYTTRGNGPLDSEFRAAGIGVVNGSKSLSGLLGIIACAVRLVVILKRQKPNLIHFFLPEAYLIGGMCSVFAGTQPRIMSRRSLSHYQSRRPFSGFLERCLHRRMNAVIANSTAVLRELEGEGVDPKKLVTIMNGVDINKFGKVGKQTSRKKLGLYPGQLVLTCVANLIPYKGHSDLLTALSSIRDRLPKTWTLLIVGRDEGIGNELRNEARRLRIAENIRWLGERGDLPNIYAASDVCLLCSHEEGLPNAVLEAQASGVPVVVTDVGGSPEAINDGRTGILVPPHSPASIAKAILLLAGDASLRFGMGRKAKIWINESFSLIACVEAHQSLYSRLLAKRGAVSRSVSLVE